MAEHDDGPAVRTAHAERAWWAGWADYLRGRLCYCSRHGADGGDSGEQIDGVYLVESCRCPPTIPVFFFATRRCSNSVHSSLFGNGKKLYVYFYY